MAAFWSVSSAFRTTSQNAGINTAMSSLKCSEIERGVKLLMWPPITIVFREGFDDNTDHRAISWEMRETNVIVYRSRFHATRHS
jgi:hypothetical protein